MKGEQKVIEALNSLLADELTAISQYMVHAEMCENWGYDKLGDVVQKRAIEEMKHAEKLIGRIPIPRSIPIVSEINMRYRKESYGQLIEEHKELTEKLIQAAEKCSLMAKDFASSTEQSEKWEEGNRGLGKVNEELKEISDKMP